MKKHLGSLGEIIFDIFYLLIIFLSAIWLYKTAEFGSTRFRFAMMGFLLGVGDSFHLIPRIISLLNKGQKDYRISLGVGKLITSITMTIFYLFLWEIGKKYYSFNLSILSSIIVYSLALARIILCLFPENQWTSKTPSLKWGFIRNIPFLILGLIVTILFLL